MADNIISGVPSGYIPPISAGSGIPIVAPPEKSGGRPLSKSRLPSIRAYNSMLLDMLIAEKQLENQQNFPKPAGQNGASSLFGTMSGSIISLVTLVYDEFTDADGTLLTSHVIAPINLPGNSWVLARSIATNMTTESNKSSSNSIATGEWDAVNCGNANVTITVTTQMSAADANSSAAILGRWESGAGINCFLCDYSLSSYNIYEVANATFTQRATGAFTADTNTHNLKLIMSGTSLTFTIDSGTALAYSTATYQTNTSHGCGGYPGLAGEPTTFDNFKVTAP